MAFFNYSGELPSVKDLVKDGHTVAFHHYQNGELWYDHSSGFRFPVPISDTGDAVFAASDRAILFMRWIRKYIDAIKKEWPASATD